TVQLVVALANNVSLSQLGVDPWPEVPPLPEGQMDETAWAVAAAAIVVATTAVAIAAAAGASGAVHGRRRKTAPVSGLWIDEAGRGVKIDNLDCGDCGVAPPGCGKEAHHHPAISISWLGKSSAPVKAAFVSSEGSCARYSNGKLELQQLSDVRLELSGTESGTSILARKPQNKCVATCMALAPMLLLVVIGVL
ncbi:unnamed protein product, partial [Polarella glacialis]